MHNMWHSDKGVSEQSNINFKILGINTHSTKNLLHTYIHSYIYNNIRVHTHAGWNPMLFSTNHNHKHILMSIFEIWWFLHHINGWRENDHFRCRSVNLFLLSIFSLRAIKNKEKEEGLKPHPPWIDHCQEWLGARSPQLKSNSRHIYPHQ